MEDAHQFLGLQLGKMERKCFSEMIIHLYSHSQRRRNMFLIENMITALIHIQMNYLDLVVVVTSKSMTIATLVMKEAFLILVGHFNHLRE